MALEIQLPHQEPQTEADLREAYHSIRKQLEDAEDTREKQRNDIATMLRGAVRVELSTIPLYLYSMYSIIKDGKGGTEARARISVVLHQEMLHLALAGNILASIDKGPHLYTVSMLPTYGGEGDVILYSKIPLKLEPCEKANLERFVKIEAPYISPPKISAKHESANVGVHYTEPMRGELETYKSIGDFYTELEYKIRASRIYGIPYGNKDLQFSSEEFFRDMIQVTDQESALEALKIIIDQGEGSVGVKEAHYQMFLGLYQQRTDWKVHPIPYSPTKDLYKNNKFVYELALASNAAYCYLLITIQKTWRVNDRALRRKLVTNIHSIMLNVMTPIADIMVEQPFETGANPRHAAPTFEAYDTKSGEDESKMDDAAKELFTAIENHLTEAIKATADQALKNKLGVIKFSLDHVAWPL